MNDIVLKFTPNKKGILLDVIFSWFYRKYIWFWFMNKAGASMFGNIEISSGCCHDTKIYYWQTGPTKDVKCKCGKSYMVKWD